MNKGKEAKGIKRKYKNENDRLRKYRIQRKEVYFGHNKDRFSESVQEMGGE